MYMYMKLFIILLVFVLYMCASAVAEFAEIPSSVVVELGAATPPCRCRHTSSVVLIFWRVNGSPASDFPDIRSDSVNESGKMVYTLTVPAEPQYNGTVVECLAVFLDGVTPTEVTPAATIMFLDTPTNPPTIAPATFDVVPSPLTVAVEQGTATFQCQHPLADGVIWSLNGTSLNRVGLANVSTSMQLQGSVTTYTLSIGALTEYSQTTVECVAIFIDESPSLTTEPVTLLIQDTPKEVANAACQRDYTSNTLVTFWSPLPTLDINDTDPDIVYTVKLFRTTCGQNTLLNQTTVAGSNVTAEDLDLMQTYKAVVFARNNVPEARNGPSVGMNETFAFLSGSTLFYLARNSQVSYMSLDPFPSFYVVHLESLDGLGNNLRINITARRSNEMINLTMEEELPPKSLWNASILTYGCQTDTAVIELSTHDLQNVTVNSSFPNEIRVRGDFADGSTATGVLLIIYSHTDDSDIRYIAKQKEAESTFDARVNGLSGTQYGVSVFALENQLPFLRVVTSPKTVTVAADNDQATTQESSIEYNLEATSTGVCVTCTFLDSSTTDCLVVVHQHINSSGLMNIESSHRFTRSLTGDTAYGCIEGINQRQFKIGVAGGKMVTEPSTIKEQSSPVGAIVAGTVLGVLAFIVIVVTVIAILKYMRKKGRKIGHAAAEPQYAVVRKNHCPVQSEDLESGSPNLSPTPPQQERSAEVEPLLPPPIPPRVVADGTSSSPEPESAANHSLEDHQNASGPPPVLADNGGPTYAQPVLLKSLKNTVHPPPTTEKTGYNDIGGFQNQQGQHYALPQVESTSKGGALDDLHQVVYVKVKPHSSITEQSEDQNIDCTSSCADTPPEPAAPIREPFTTERLFSFLLPHASKWHSLGEALSLDDDRLDEIFTNNETDEACLQEMIELYMVRSDLDHSWEEIEAALQKIDISSNVGASVQEVSPPEDSPRIGGNTMHVSRTHAAHPDQDGKDQGVGAIHGMDPQSEVSHNTSHQFSSDKQPTHKEDIQNGEQGDSIDYGYSGSESSESESNDSGALPETEEDSGEFSASSEERSESVEESKPNNHLSTPVKDTLENFKSGLNPAPGSQATLKENVNGSGEFDRTTEKEEEIGTVISSPDDPCSSAGDDCQQVKVFGMIVEDPRKDGHLHMGVCGEAEDWSCIEDVYNICCQDSQEHIEYEPALKRQMRFHIDQKNKNKSDQHTVEESPQECSSTCKIGTLTTPASQIDEGVTLCTHSSNGALHVECTDDKDTHKCNRNSQFSTIPLANAASSCHKVQTVQYKYSELSKDTSDKLLITKEFHTHNASMIPNTHDHVVNDNSIVRACTSLSSNFLIPSLLITQH